MKYHGPERRKHADDHDTVVQLLEIMNNHVGNFDTHREDYRRHIIDDNKFFEEIRKNIAGIHRIGWVALGALLALQVLPKVVEVIHILIK